MTSPRAAEVAPRRGVPRTDELRPDLRVVDPTTRRADPRRVGVIAGIVLFVALFALAGFQTIIINAQSHLDDVTRRADAEAEQSKQLGLELAELRSPERITSEARDRLGMVAPAGVAFLQPQPGDDAKAAEVPPATPPTTAAPRPTPTTTPTTAPTSKKTTTPTTTPKTTTSTTTPRTTTTPTTRPAGTAR